MRAVKWAAIAAVVASVVPAVIFTTRIGEDPNLIPSPPLGRPAPELELPLLDGSGTLDLATLDGQSVLVNFLAS
jgi:cytochrome c biogenesis protein CcmG/thiol:disulfide interchange protein DsbE